MIQLIIGVAIIGALYTLIKHIIKGRSSEDIVKEVLKGAYANVKIVLFLFILICVIVYFVLYF